MLERLIVNYRAPASLGPGPILQLCHRGYASVAVSRQWLASNSPKGQTLTTGCSSNNWLAPLLNGHVPTTGNLLRGVMSPGVTNQGELVALTAPISALRLLSSPRRSFSSLTRQEKRDLRKAKRAEREAALENAGMGIKRPRHLRAKNQGDSIFTKVVISGWMVAFFAIAGASFISFLGYIWLDTSGYNLYHDSLELIEEHPRICELLGHPLSSKLSNRRSPAISTFSGVSATVRYTVSGPLGQGVVTVEKRKVKGEWRFHEVFVECQPDTIKTDRTIHVDIYQDGKPCVSDRVGGWRGAWRRVAGRRTNQ